MTRDREVLESAWEKNAAIAADILKSGRDAAFITLGDPLLYSTFGYLLPRLRAIAPQPRCPIVPGITSYQAAAAAAGEVLAESGESLLILSGVAGEARNGELLEMGDRAVILKAYRNFPAIREMLRRQGRDRGTIFATRLGIEGEMVVRGLDAAPDAPHYLSLCLVSRSNKHVNGFSGIIRGRPRRPKGFALWNPLVNPEYFLTRKVSLFLAGCARGPLFPGGRSGRGYLRELILPNLLDSAR
jgi:precorrin-2/cobalt-factor-2 C20-methyltransferase